MGRTITKKREAREQRLKTLPQGERLVKSALIKKKEGRILDASEKHALKMSSEHGEVLRLWEKLRTAQERDNEGEDATATPTSKKTAYEHKYPIVEKLMRLIEPKFATMVRTPSVSRVLQSMIKYGSAAHVEKVLRWVSKDFFSFSTDAYAHFVVAALIRHASHDQFDKVLAAVVPVVPQLITHKFGVEVIHATYSSKWCSPSNRDLLVLAIFKENVAVMKRWVGYPVLERVTRENPSIQKRLLTRLFELSDKLVSQKEAVGYPFVQRMVYAFMQHGTREEVSELCDTMRPHVANIALTREGAPLASLVFCLTEPKKRKEILRSIKDNLGEISTNKYGAPVVARVLDYLYDIQLLNKYLLNDITEHMGQLLNSPYGFLIIMHLLTPQDERKWRFLLPNWKEHNIYSLSNSEWNHHTWLTAEYEPEVVELCSHPAMATHLSAIPTLVKAFFDYVEKHADKMNRHHVSLIARELLVASDAHPQYKAALNLTSAQRETLEKLAPALGSDRRRQRDTDADTDAAPVKKKKLESKTSGNSEKETKKPLKAAAGAKRSSSTSASVKGSKARKK